ncbi:MULTISPECIES: hypothetical protein [unclassified Vibrio]|uniref:hypothetical protein n=1 Tax=unclassified Vibrio TaxID=2614977 RepID=UPI003075DCAB
MLTSAKKLSLIALTSTISCYVMAESPTRPTTSMDIIAEQQALPCESMLTEFAAEVLKLNPHRMLEQITPISHDQLFHAFTVTDYRDRASHITFHAVENAAGQCQATAIESYLLQTNCADARHEAFSKWTFQGKLNQETMVLTSDRIAGKQAFLTDQSPAVCLVTTRYQVIKPASQ